MIKTAFFLCVACCFLGLGILNVINQKKKSRAVEEILGFIVLVKNELEYKKSDYETLCNLGKAQGYKSISFSKGEIILENGIEPKWSRDFQSFTDGLGKTHAGGQIAMCEEFHSRFKAYRDTQIVKEKEKIQVNTSLSLMGAVCVCIFLI